MRLAERRQAHRSISGSSAANNDDDAELLRHPRQHRPSSSSFFFGAGDETFYKQQQLQRQLQRQWTERMVRVTGITALIVLLVMAAVASVKGQVTEGCLTRNMPIGVSIEETVEAGETKTFLGLLAYFGGSIEANDAPMSIVVANDKFACKPIGPVSGVGSSICTPNTRAWVCDACPFFLFLLSFTFSGV